MRYKIILIFIVNNWYGVACTVKRKSTRSTVTLMKKKTFFQLHHFIISDSKVNSDDARHAAQYPQHDCCVWINQCLAAEWKIMTSSTVVTWQIDQCVFLLAATTDSSSHLSLCPCWWCEKVNVLDVSMWYVRKLLFASYEWKMFVYLDG